jgi:hypothetical protein
MAGFNPNYSNSQISSNWLAGVADNTPISMIAYMGSHNSAAWMNARNEAWWGVQNQSERDLSAQFAAGNRSFSLRFATPRSWNDGSVLQAVHGDYNLNSVLPDLAKQLVRSLAVNPSEFIKVSLDIYEEGKGNIEGYKQGQDFFAQFLEPITDENGVIQKNQDGSPKIDIFRSKSKAWSQEVFDRYGLNDLTKAQKDQLLGKPMAWVPLSNPKYLKDPQTGLDYIGSNGKKIQLDGYTIPSVGDVRGKFIFQIPWMWNNLPNDQNDTHFKLINQLYPNSLKPRLNTFYNGSKKNVDMNANGWFSPQNLALFDANLAKQYPNGLFSNRIPKVKTDDGNKEYTEAFFYDYNGYDADGIADNGVAIRSKMNEAIDAVSKFGAEFLGFYGVYASGANTAVNGIYGVNSNILGPKVPTGFYQDYITGSLYDRMLNAGTEVRGEFFSDYVAWDSDGSREPLFPDFPIRKNLYTPAAYVADKSPSIDLFLQRSSVPTRSGKYSQQYDLIGYCDDPTIRSSDAVKVRIKSLDPSNLSPFYNLELDPITNSFIIPIQQGVVPQGDQPFQFKQQINPGKSSQLVYNPNYKGDSFMLLSYSTGLDGSMNQFGAPRLYCIDNASTRANHINAILFDLA